MRTRAAAPAIALALLALLPAPGATQQIDGSAIDAVFADIGAGGPGCAVGVYRVGEILYSNGYGTANLDYDLPITPASVFYLGSVGKQFTAAAVLHAVRAGHLSLDDPIQRWITEMPEYESEVTVRHLVHHTSGVRDYLTLMSLAGVPLEVPVSDPDVVGLIADQQGLNFPAGDRYLYSNSGYFLLAQIVERATGDSLRDYLEEHFFEPLGMSSTRVHDDRREPMPNRVVGYRSVGPRAFMDHPWSFDKVGSGGVYSSIEDMARWDRNWFTEEVGGEGFTDGLREVGVLNDGRELPYAFGVNLLDYRGQPIVEHGGALAAFRSHILRFPELNSTMMVACSFPTADPGSRARRVADAVLADLLDPIVAVEEEATEPAGPTPELTTAQLDRFVGDWDSDIGIRIAIERVDDGLVFIQNGQRVPLVIRAEDRIAIPAVDVEMTLLELRDGAYHRMSVTQRNQTFSSWRIEAPVVPDWGDAAGRWYSAELGVSWEIVVEGEEARLVVVRGAERPLSWIDENRWDAPGLELSMEWENGSIVGFTVDAGRAAGMRFVRDGR